MRYLRYGLSYRDVEELLAERGITVDHVTIYRWVQTTVPPVLLLPADIAATQEVRVLSRPEVGEPSVLFRWRSSGGWPGTQLR